MIEQVLFYALGVLSAALLWLLLLPAFWRRATRITRMSIEQGLPLTPNEIAAEQDRLRAERAVELGRMEREVEAVRRQIVAAKAETGERLKAETGFLNTIEDGRRRIADLQSEGETLRRRIADLEGNLAAMTEARERAEADIFRLETQRDAIGKRLNEAAELAEERRIRIDDLTHGLQSKSDALDNETLRATNLRLELQTAEIRLREAQRELAELTTIAARHAAVAGLAAGQGRSESDDAKPPPAAILVKETPDKAGKAVAS